MFDILSLVLALTLQGAGQQTSPPQNRPTAAVQSRTPPPLYNELADAKDAIATAIKGAADDDIRVLINWGANDDPGCKKFADAKNAPELVQAKPPFFSDEYKVVNVDVGHLDKNIGLAKSYGAKLWPGKLPAFTVLTATGKVLANTTAAALRAESDPEGISAAKVADFLKKHQAPDPDAVKPFDSALKQAQKDVKCVFVWFSAPW